MKKLLYIGTPHNTLLPAEYVTRLVLTWRDLFDKYDLFMGFTESALIHRNRNQLFAGANEVNADYLMFIDSDIVWQSTHQNGKGEVIPNDIERLIEFDRDVVSGLYKTRRPLGDFGHVPTAYFIKDGKLNFYTDIPDNPFKADAVGMGFCLIKGEVVKKMVELTPKLGYPFDYFDIHDMGLDKESGTNVVGEDLSFCNRLHKAGFDIWVNPKVKVGHLVTRMVV